jgi:hypothetical protein
MYYYEGTNPMDRSDGISAGENYVGSPLYNQTLQERGDLLVKYYSNIGSDDPKKSKFPLPRSLFYDAAKLDPSVKQAEKYGLFTFYSFDGSGGPNFYLDQYYLSERSEYNKLISSPQSKNPTAGQLVKDSDLARLLDSGKDSETLPNNNPIKGGVHAPYYWKDFVYCKYYGTIPNNRLITLRRFSGAVLDNFSLPAGLRTPENLKLGVGVPVAQAVTWFGGNTGNSLNSLIGFSTGLEWDTESIEPERVQKAFGDGLLNSVAFDVLSDLVSQVGGGNGTADKVTDEQKKLGLEALATTLSPDKDQLTKDRYYKAFFDAVKSDTDGRFGILSEKIWVPVDVIKETSKRAFGLSFTWTDLILKFTYDLTSVGEVNSKAAMFDIIGNLLSIGTNYGNFLVPHIKYDSDYSALTFPGGDEGAKLFYTDLFSFVKTNLAKMFIAEDSSGTGVGGAQVDKPKAESFDKKLQELQNQLSDGKVDENEEELARELLGSIQSVFGEYAAAKWQAPMSLYSGAAIGEWHVVIGNPYNPIAMIGNLICKNVSVSFSDALGPDDFPTTVEASITLAHARPRERGEIESIFNRGDGRLYQTVKSTSSNAQTYNSEIDISGQVFNPLTIPNFFGGVDGDLPGVNGSVTFDDTEF